VRRELAQRTLHFTENDEKKREKKTLSNKKIEEINKQEKEFVAIGMKRKNHITA
jgi:hypothetical protein